MPTLSIERRDLAAQPVLIIRRRISARRTASHDGGLFWQSLRPLHEAGASARWAAIYALPLDRPRAVDDRMRQAARDSGNGEGEIEAATLPAGPLAMAVHGGLYDRAPRDLRGARTLDRGERPSRGQRSVGVLHHQPGRDPDPADWRTERPTGRWRNERWIAPASTRFALSARAISVTRCRMIARSRPDPRPLRHTARRSGRSMPQPSRSASAPSHACRAQWRRDLAGHRSQR